MRSSGGFYQERLDHLRALAVTLVVFSHHLHGGGDRPLLPTSYVAPDWAFPFSLWEEGQCGVSLFMVLSGYLFVRLIGDRRIVFPAFLRNRALRLLPLLAIVLLPHWLNGSANFASLARGFLSGWEPDGSWSIAVEMQFYLLLPALLAVPARWQVAVWAALAGAAVLLRILLWKQGVPDLLHLTHYSLVGRADNFLIGMVLARTEPALRMWSGSRVTAALIVILFLLAMHLFNRGGGMVMDPGSIAWAVMPMVESLGFAALIFWYCSAGPSFLPKAVERLLTVVGESSYSIYLLHFSVIVGFLHVWRAAGFEALSPWAATLLFVPVFAVCLAIGRVSYLAIERPFLALRTPYLRPRQAHPVSGATPVGLPR